MREAIQRFHGLRRAEKRERLESHLRELWGISDEKTACAAVDEVARAIGFSPYEPAATRASTTAARAAAAIMTLIGHRWKEAFPQATQREACDDFVKRGAMWVTNHDHRRELPTAADAEAFLPRPETIKNVDAPHDFHRLWEQFDACMEDEEAMRECVLTVNGVRVKDPDYDPTDDDGDGAMDGPRARRGSATGEDHDAPGPHRGTMSPMGDVVHGLVQLHESVAAASKRLKTEHDGAKKRISAMRNVPSAPN